MKAMEVSQNHYLSTDIKALEDWMQACPGGLWKPGEMIELGMPHGGNTRALLLSFLRHSPGLSILWINGRKDLEVYPPAWAALGVDLESIYFVNCKRPVSTLRPVFLESVFSLIILDSPEKLTQGELFFAVSAARKNKQNLVVIRDYFLSAKRGNPLARLRLNCSWSKDHQALELWAIRGNPQRLYLKAKDLQWTIY